LTGGQKFTDFTGTIETNTEDEINEVIIVFRRGVLREVLENK